MRLVQLKDLFNEYLALDQDQARAHSGSGLVWKKKTSKHSPSIVGDMAGSKNSKGYWRVTLKGKEYKAHRIVAVLADLPLVDKLKKGSMQMVVDHKKGNRSDNSPESLRIVTVSENNFNRYLISNYVWY